MQLNLRFADIKPLGIYIIFDVNKCVQEEPIDVDKDQTENVFTLMMSHSKTKQNKVHSSNARATIYHGGFGSHLLIPLVFRTKSMFPILVKRFNKKTPHVRTSFEKSNE